MASEKDNNNIQIEDIEVPQNLAPEVDQEKVPVSADVQSELEKEIELESKYGSAPGRTFAEALASGMTFGISDQALVKSGAVTQEALRERRNRNEEAAITGEVAGIVAPTIATGGASLAAKGAQVAGKGVLGAAKTGQAVEQLTAKSLKKMLKSTGNEKLARKVLEKSTSKAVGSAVEGSFYGAGQLVKEDALGEADFNAENLLAYTGMGAALSGAAGGIFGTAEALVPVAVKKTGAVKDYVSKKVATNKDVNLAAAEVSGMTPSRITKLKERRQDIYENMAPYYRDRLKLKASDSAESLYTKNQEAISQIGKDIDNTLTQVDSLADPRLLPTRKEVSEKIVKELDDLASDFKDLPSTAAKRNLKKIRGEQTSWQKWAEKDATLTAKDVQKLKIRLQKLAKWERTFDKTSLDEKAARKASEAVRLTMLDVADRVSTTDTNLGSMLRQQNLDFGTAMELANSLKKKVDKEATNKNLIGLKDLLLGDIFLDANQSLLGAGAIVGKKFLESDFRRKLTILSSIERANQRIDLKLASSVSNFFKKSKRAIIPTSTKILMNTSFSIDGDKKKPKTRKEAFKKVRKDLMKLESSQNNLLEHISKNNLRLTNSAPNTALAVDTTLLKAVQFLNQKLPKPANQRGMIQNLMLDKTFEPSSLEISKFERYLEAVENPAKVLDDLESGIISREGIEAIKAVYPNIYRRLQNKVMDEIHQNFEKINYSDRLQLGVVLDIPTDTSLIPSNIKGLQQIHAEEQEQDLRASGLDDLSMAEQAESGTEKVATRE